MILYSRKTAFFMLLLISVHLDSGFAIQCYECNSKHHDGCEDVSDNSYLKNCSELKEGPKYTGCRKIEQWIDFEMLNEAANKRIIRQCALPTDEKDCIYRAGYGSRTNVCHCFEDKCNAASGLSISVVIVMSGAFSLVKLFL
ncbi:UPAR/Ly6 domain-containing protein crok-like [Tachypleus tridentatus]|uniref:UPAR/Ly6 domain-containing protein crok-like n=1 Tax=Tachypleus tridentatus TaxID=6853 RepID=UPI003FD1299F